MLEQILKSIREARADKELWLCTETYNYLLSRRTEETLKSRSETNKAHIITLKFEDGTEIGVTLEENSLLRSGEYAYVKVLGINKKRFAEYENACTVL